MGIIILIIVAVVGVAMGAYFTSRESVEELASELAYSSTSIFIVASLLKK